MNIYEELIYRVEEGEPFYISLEKRQMRVGKKWLVRDGTYDGDLIDPAVADMTFNQIITEIERLYHEYKHSLPSAHSKVSYFKALPVEELDDTAWFCGERRELAQAMLEGFVLCAELLGKFDFNGWFWKSKADRDLVILADWVK